MEVFSISFRHGPKFAQSLKSLHISPVRCLKKYDCTPFQFLENWLPIWFRMAGKIEGKKFAWEFFGQYNFSTLSLRVVVQVTYYFCFIISFYITCLKTVRISITWKQLERDFSGLYFERNLSFLAHFLQKLWLLKAVLRKGNFDTIQAYLEFV